MEMEEAFVQQKIFCNNIEGYPEKINKKGY